MTPRFVSLIKYPKLLLFIFDYVTSPHKHFTFGSFQTLRTLNSMSETKDWSTIKVYSDLCIQTLRRAMDHLLISFHTELKTLTNIGKLSVVFV